MRQINFLIIFALCLVLALFSLENTTPVTIQVVGGVQVEAPLAIELICAMGLGGVIAWMFSIWARLLGYLSSRRVVGQIQTKEQRIQELQQDVERYKVELEEQQLPALSAADSVKEGA